MNFNTLMARADEETLRDLVGPDVTRLLIRLDPDLAKPSKLRELLKLQRTPSDLIRDPKARTALFRMLSPNQAEALVKGLGLGSRNGSRDPYELLTSLKLRKGSTQEAKLHRLLGVSVDEEVSRNEILPDKPAEPRYPLFHHQRVATSEVVDALRDGPGRAILHMPTGSGKTRTAMNVVCDYLRAGEPRMAVWLAYSEELCEQAASEFERAWGALGNRTLKVFRFWGSNPIEIDNARDGLVVCGLDKMYNSIRSNYQTWSRLADRSRLVIIDEAHQALAPTYKDVLELLVDRHAETCLLGLTATPGRTWNDLDEDRKLSNFFANKKVTLKVADYANPVDYLIDEGYLARTEYESLTYSGDVNVGPKDFRQIEQATDIPTEVLEQLAGDDTRNLLIVTRVESLIRTHSRVIVFATTAQHSNILATVLAARGIRASSVTSKTSPSERQRLIAAFRSDAEEPQVLCNYGVLTTGFDAPRTSAAIIARPTKSLVLYSQMVGRATRGVQAGGNKEALVVTIVDTSLPGFGGMSEAFTNWEDVWDA
ncbi:DEAD/DEAH box helicase [Rhodococcus spongiicola]|uniref:DEAD/DEAH box helicase n=1 Tax=Rhodococcus spongiicola TaxID=2487352 RepID=A0A3S3ABY9_9NOCA|nr:DEAD/DEAH box helicase [Rhodococcus spongiicola]